ncbi:MAG: hypothetical protein ABI904_09785 [Chloroflexota bacterium]
MKARIISLLCLLSLALSSCSISVTPGGESPDLPPLNPQEVPAQTSPASPLPDSPTQGDATQMNPTPQTPFSSALQGLIEKAKEDLAQRLSITTAEINVSEAAEVTWADASLGCPQKGMVYAEVLTPGYLIRLEYGGNVYEYHTSRHDQVVTCKDPSPPVPGAPNNT